MKKSILLVFVFCTLSPVFPQSPTDILRLLLDKGLVDSTDIIDPILGTKVSSSLLGKKLFPAIEAHAMGQLGYRWSDSSEPAHTISLERLFLWAKAQLNAKVDVFFLYSVAPYALRAVGEFYGRYRIHPTISVRVGGMLVPFTIENLVPTGVFHTPDYSQAVSALAGVSDDVIGLHAGRDWGIEASGELIPLKDRNLLSYKVGLFNGAGIQHLKDNNGDKDLVVNAGVQPLKNWHIVWSAVWGNANYIAQGDTLASNHDRNRWSWGTVYDSKHFYFRGEYVGGQDGQFNRHGFYAMGIYRPIQTMDITAVYDWYNKMKEDPNSISVKYKLGLTYRFNTLCRVQGFYTYHDYPNQNRHSNNFIAQLQLAF